MLLSATRLVVRSVFSLVVASVDKFTPFKTLTSWFPGSFPSVSCVSVASFSLIQQTQYVTPAVRELF